MTIISKNIQKAVEILKNEELVAIPTETVYGLAGNIYSEKAIARIFEMKSRPLFNPLIVHIHHIDQLDEFVSYVPPKAKLLAKAFWPGSLTLVLKKKTNVPDIITAGKDSVAIRIPNHPLTLDLLVQLHFPLAAPSANPFGCISPTKATHVEDYFGKDLQMVLDGGNCANGIESTIIGFENDEPILFRLGAISTEEIEALVGRIKIKNTNNASPDAPGMLLKHYAPLTPTFLSDDVATYLKNFENKNIGLLLFSKKINAPNNVLQKLLSATGDLKEAAANLYDALHYFDKLKLDMIIAEKLPETGLGKSINDRLERATKK